MSDRSSQFFSAAPAEDLTYRNLQRVTNPQTVAAREHCESLWTRFAPYADGHFLAELPRRFHARYWEMYLVVAVMDLGHEITAPKPGPDFGIAVDGRRVWFEAVTATPGASTNADRVPGFAFGTMQSVPNEQMVLRYASAISEKVLRQYPKWLENGVLGPDDCLVVAINPKLLDHEVFDTITPRILQVAYPVGAPAVAVNPHTGAVIEHRVQYRAAIQRASGSQVATGLFLDPQYAPLSALLCSRVDVGNHPEYLGEDFQFAPNPRATTPVPQAVQLIGTLFRPHPSEDHIDIETVTAEPAPFDATDGVQSIRDILADPEWMSDPDGKAVREAHRAIDELRGRTSK